MNLTLKQAFHSSDYQRIKCTKKVIVHNDNEHSNVCS